MTTTEADVVQDVAPGDRAPGAAGHAVEDDGHGDAGPDRGPGGEHEPGGYGSFAMGGLAGLVGLAGLAIASGAHEGTMHAVGMLVFLGSVAFVLWLMKRAFDRAELRARGG